MLWRDFPEPGRPFCSDRRSNDDRSRGAACRFPAGSSSRLAHSTARRRIAGWASCHSLIRISCGAPNAGQKRSWTFCHLQSAVPDYSKTRTIEIEARLYIGKRPISKRDRKSIRRFRVLALHARFSCAAANVRVTRSTAAGVAAQIKLTFN